MCEIFTPLHLYAWPDVLTVCRGGHGLSDLTTDGGPGTVCPAGLGHEGGQGMPRVQYAMDHRLLICGLQTGPYSDVFYRQGLTVMCFTDRILQ